MKKLSFLFIGSVFLLLSTAKFSYTQIIDESFEEWPPSSWTIEPESGNGAWVQDNGDFPTAEGNAGPGASYEGEFAAMFSNYDYIPNVEGSIISPELDLSSLEIPYLSFMWWNNDAPLEPALLKISSSTDGITYIDLDIIETKGSVTWIEYHKVLEADVSYIKLTAISDYGLKNTYVDAFLIDEAPACVQPSNLQLLQATATDAIIDWVNGSNEELWEIQYGPTGFNLGEGIGMETDYHPFQITELIENTDYDVYIRSICGENTFSEWKGPLSFTTECGVIIPFSWEEGFEDGDLGCFSVNQFNAEETWYWTNETLFTPPYAGIGHARIGYSLLPQNEWLISPVFDLTNLETSIVEFYWALSYTYAISPDDNYDLFFKVTTDGGFSWTSLWDESMIPEFENWEYYNQSIDLHNYLGESNFQFAFNYVGTDGAAAYIDEISLTSQVAVNELSNNVNTIYTYPNPATNVIHLKSDEIMTRISIYNLAGQLVLEQNISNQKRTSLKTNTIPNGMFLLKVETENSISTQSISINH